MKVTKWSINSGELHVSEQSQTQDAPKAEASAAAPDAGQDRLPGDCARPRGAEGDAPKAEAPKVEAPKVEANAARPAPPARC